MSVSEMSVTEIVSERGNVILSIGGYRYHKNRQLVTGEDVWRCSACQVRVKTITCPESKRRVLVQKHPPHEHPPDLRKLERQIVTQRVKRKAVEKLTENPRKLIRKTIDKDIINLTVSDLPLITRNIYNERRRYLPPNPHSLQDLSEYLNEEHPLHENPPDLRKLDRQIVTQGIKGKAVEDLTENPRKLIRRTIDKDIINLTETSLLKDATAPDECRTGKDLGAREIINLDSGSDSENSMDYDIIPEIKMEHNQIKVDRWRPDGSDEPLKATKTEPQNSDTCNQRLTTGRVRISDVTTCLNGSVPHSSTLNLDPVSINAVVEEPSCATNTQTDSYTSHSTGSDLTILEGSVISLREDKSIIPMSSSFPNHNNGNQNLVVNEPLTDSRISATSVYSDSTNTAIEPLPYPSEQTLPKSKSLLEMNEFEAFGQYLGVQLINLPLDLALELQKNIENLLAMSRKKNNPNKTSFAQCEGELINIEDDDISISE